MSNSTLIAGRTGIAAGPLSIVLRPRVTVTAILLVALACGMLALAATTGSLAIAPDRVLAVIFGQGSDVENLVIGKRLTRAGLALLVGAALGMAGGITQSMLRNPLASPDILGFTSGASLAAVVVIAFPIAGIPLGITVPVAALVGAISSCLVIVALAVRRHLDPFRLVLVGIAVSALAQAVMSWLLMRTELDTAATAMRWLSGSVAAARGEDVALLGVVVTVGIVAAAALARPLASLRLGPDVARALGVRPLRSQLGLAALSIALVAVAVAVAGPVGFVAFVAPQLAMRLGNTAGPPVVLSGLAGAALVAAADMLAQALPMELPVGIITSVVGAPVLLVLLFRSVRKVSA